MCEVNLPVLHRSELSGLMRGVRGRWRETERQTEQCAVISLSVVLHEGTDLRGLSKWLRRLYLKAVMKGCKNMVSLESREEVFSLA